MSLADCRESVYAFRTFWRLARVKPDVPRPWWRRIWMAARDPITAVRRFIRSQVRNVRRTGSRA